MGKRLLLLVFCLPGLGFGAPVLRTANEVADFQLHGETGAERTFAVTGRVNQVVGSAVRNQSGILFEDSSGVVDICVIRTAPPSPGDIVAVRGLACINHLREPWFRHVAIDVLGHGPLPEPISVRIEDLSPDRHHLRLVATRGTVVDVQHDDIDSRFDRLYLKDESTLIPVSVLRAPANQDLLDAEVSVRGVYTRNSNGYRKFAGPQIEAFSTNPVAVLRKSVGPFDCPTLEETIYVTPQDLMKLGKRRVTGTVLATWQGDRFLVERSPNHTISVRLAARAPLPKAGTRVTVAGYPETDSFRINLTKASYRTEDGRPTPSDRTPVSLADCLIRDQDGERTYDPQCHGNVLRVRGRVCSLSSGIGPSARIDILCGTLHVPVDTDACPSALDGVSEGCEIEATGVCVLEFYPWTPYDVLPRVTGFTLILRSADDLRILARPPWWTPARLAALVAILLLGLVATLVWNSMLRRLADRRGRAMLRAQIGEIRSSLKTEERTRLAVELHDSLAQTLTGVAMEIETASRYGKDNPDEMLHHHLIATRALKSCRNELRNSLWDLRYQSLDGVSVDEAVKRTLLPHLKGVTLSVRFNVLRNRLTENYLHEVLHIIRELALNGIRHGGATAVRIAGGLDGRRLVFSVRDNGTGFDATSAPGIAEGHFGLQGIRERLNRYAGALAFSRTSDGWTRASISMNLPAATGEDEDER